MAMALGLCIGASEEAQAQARPLPTVAPRESATQAVQGTPTFQPGTGFGVRTANSDEVIVTTLSSIINWTTLDTRTLDQTTDFINFLPTGTTLTFTGPGTNFTVLNRIVPTASASGGYRGISLDGTVNSFLGSSGIPGGSIWFYSPGGILVGANSAFNVGNLLLTTSDVSTGFGFVDSVSFTGAPNPFSSVIIHPNATLSLNLDAATLYVVAPSIEQYGTVSVNGDIVYASASGGSSQLIDGRLRSFIASAGEEAAAGNVFIHTGTTTGPATQSFRDAGGASITFDPQVIVFESTSSEVELLLSGSVGYAGVTEVLQDNDGRIEILAPSVTIADAAINSDLVVLGQNVSLFAGAGETISFGSDIAGAYDVIIEADNFLFGAAAGGTLDIAGSLAFGATDDVTGSVSGIVDGTVSIGGNLLLDVSFPPQDGQTAPVNQGGTISLAIGSAGSLSVGGNLDLSSFAASAGFGGNATQAFGGDISVSLAGAGSSLTVAGITTIDASADGFVAFTGSGASNAAGNVTLDIAGGTADFGTLVIDSSALATSSGAGGTGIFNAQGGDVAISVGANASLTAASISIDTSAQGAVGAPGGGTGGDGIAGNATIANTGALAVTDLTVVANGLGGEGGAADAIAPGGVGGLGRGGAVSLSSTSTITGLSDLTLSAVGGGGQGGLAYYGSGPNSGGAGGIGLGGSVAIEMSGQGTTLQGLAAMSWDVSGIGGAGAAGPDVFAGSSTGANGGNGTGGTLSLTARTGALIEITAAATPLAANGIGGAGGDGGYGYYGTTGGDGGSGTGGTVRLVAQGGTITGGDLTITSTGTGGLAGIGQDGFSGYYGTVGANGGGAGGTIDIQLLEGSPGIISIGNAIIDASGIGGGGDISVPTAGGSIAITDASTDPAGLLTMTSLNATAFGAGTSGNFLMAGDSGPITVTGDVFVTVSGAITFDFANSGQLAAGGLVSMSAGTDVLVAHTANTNGIASISTGGEFSAFAGGDFAVSSGAIIDSGAAARVRANGNIDVDDILGVQLVDLSAGQNATVNNAAVTGAPVVVNLGAGQVVASGLFISAGDNNNQSFVQFDPNYNALVTGTVTSTGAITVEAGGSATFAAGSSTISDNGLNVRTGDDIVIASGASLVAAANPATTFDPANPFFNFNNLVLSAGGISGPELLSPITTPISSIIAAGSINSNGFSTVLAANAVDGRGGSISGNSIAADINDAPATGAAQSNDGGLLSAPCLQGNICLGTVGATNRLEIGQASNNDVIALLIEGGDVSADTILVTTRDSISIGSAGSPSGFTGATQVLIESLAGDITLLDATVSGDRIELAAAGSLLGTGSLVSANDIGVDVGADFVAALVDTGGQLTSIAGIGGALEGNYVVPGSIAVGSLVQDAAGPASFIAGGNISFGAIATAGQPIVLTAVNGSAFLGATTQGGAGSVAITAQDVTYGDLAASGAIALTATTGGISGSSLLAGTTLDLDAATSIAATGIASGGAMTLDAGGAIGFASATSGSSIGMTAGGNVAGNTIDAATGLSVAAGGTAVFGVLRQRTAGFLGSVTATSVDIGTIETASPLSLTATTGGISIANPFTTTAAVTLDAATDIALAGVSAGQLDANASGGFTSSGAIVTSGSTTITAGTGGVSLSGLTATDANITASGAVSVTGANIANALGVTGTSVTVTSPVDLAISASATNGGIDVSALGDLAVGNAQATGALALASGGLLSVNGAASGSTVSTVSADLDIGANGSLGSGTTTAVTIASDGTASMTLGGDGTAAGFALSAAEATRIFSGGDLTINAVDPGTGGNALVIGDVTFARSGASAPGQFGTGGTLRLETDGNAFVSGDLLVTRADATTQLQVVAGGTLRIDAATGNLRMEDGNAGVTGAMFLTAQDLYAVTDAALADIAGLTIAEIDARLALNDGVDRPEGMIQAGALTIETTASDVFIQNTAPGTAFAERRGFVVGSLTIVDNAGTTQPIVINGIVGTATGIDAIAATQVTSNFDANSTINGCLIRNPAGCIVAQRPDVIPEDVRELIEKEILDDLPDEVGKLVPGSMIIDLAEQEEYGRDPLIDEPVTGAGNDDLWVIEPDCDAEGADRDPACPAPEEQ